MRATSFLYSKPHQWGRLLHRYLASWWHMLLLGAVALVMAFSPSTYTRESWRAAATRIVAAAWQVLPGFTLIAALASLVIIRIVLVTAFSYGLSRFALEMVVRVLVLELIPLSAALFVAMRAGLAFNASELRSKMLATSGQSALREELVPDVIANAVAVLSLALATSGIVLVLAYVNVFGLSPWGIADYTRTVGRVFDPVVSMGFGLKTLLFGMAVAVIPSAAILECQRYGELPTSPVQPGALRLLFVLLLIEGASLLVKYI